MQGGLEVGLSKILAELENFAILQQLPCAVLESVVPYKSFDYITHDGI